MMDPQEHTGWGQRWIEAIEQLSTIWTKQMPRGKDYAGKGHVGKLEVKPGKITARVQGSRSKPYVTTVELQPHKKSSWNDLIAELAQQSRWVADLLNGQIPDQIEQHFEAQRLALFPLRNSEVLTNCNCPEKGRPCKHIAAVHYAFAEALDGDPFLLFELRGLDRQGLVDNFYRTWFPEAAEEQQVEDETTRSYAEPIMPQSADRFNRADDTIPEINIQLRPNRESGTLLEQLGVPPSWSLPIQPADLLNNVVEQASALALDLAINDGDASTVEQDYDEIEQELEVETDEIDNPLFRSLSATAPDVPVTTANLPNALPDAALLQGAIGVDLQAAEKNQARSVTRKKKEVAETPVASAPAVLRRRSTKKAEDEAPAPAVVTRRKATVTTRPKKQETENVPPHVAALPVEDSDTTTQSEAIVEAVGTPVVRKRKRRTVIGSVKTKQPVALDAEARAAWEDGDPKTTWDKALEAWKVEPSDSRFQLLAASADLIKNSVEGLQQLAQETEDDARRAGRIVSSQQLMVLLTAGKYDVATEFIMAMDNVAWRGDDPPGLVYLSFLLMALGSDLDVPETSSLTIIWNHLFSRGEETFATSENPPAPVGVWLDFTLQDVPLDEALEVQYLQVARNLGIWLIETAREQPLSLKPSEIADLAVAVAEALLLLADEDACDQYTGIASARAAAQPMLGNAIRDAISNSSVLGFGGGV